MNRPGRVETLPLSRIGTYDVGVIGRNKHHMMGLLEVDVTTAREELRALRRAGTSVSFTSWFVRSVAEVAAEMPEVHGALQGRRRRVLFDEVDIALMVERDVEGTVVPLPVVLRNCASKGIDAIEAEIAKAKAQPIEGTRDYELGRRRSPLFMQLFYRLPQRVRVWIMKSILRSPERRRATMGTVMITSLAGGLRAPGWIVPKSMHNLVFGLGAVVRKPRVVGEEVLPRDVLHLTLLFDHDVVDGGPAARFVSRLVRRLETASALTQRPDDPGAGSRWTTGFR
jgi:pyruvate/2-oxoglutarate dehydrogenase complex dihydrolipoamide acyltransferase (E2) component